MVGAKDDQAEDSANNSPETSIVPELCPILQECRSLDLGVDACQRIVHACMPPDCHTRRPRHDDDICFVWLVPYSLIRLLFCWGLRFSLLVLGRLTADTTPIPGLAFRTARKRKENSADCCPCDKKQPPNHRVWFASTKRQLFRVLSLPGLIQGGRASFLLSFPAGSFLVESGTDRSPRQFRYARCWHRAIGVRRAMRIW
ncbi:hypothetical protein B0T24DRAFT_1977 [Lasiosphaeria ovina]|uniref:Uncharacterized protein n=1 Tax=Lasiosphaeria ovina TaxID=92902 RepID=A0AAE0NIP4_9PEZI|nr:hypothetical protein B0T24DRAFT_1977 [Lasiosphaeria ovina]